MTCESWQERILEREYLDQVQLRYLDQHLSNCNHCRAWAKALAEAEVMVTNQLLAETDPLEFRARLLRALARERQRNWMTAVPDLLDVLGWSAVGVLGMIGLLLWTNWATRFGNHLIWIGVAVLVGTMAWAASVFWKEESEARSYL